MEEDYLQPQYEGEEGSDYNPQQQRGVAFLSPYQQYGSSIILLTSTDTELHKLELTLRSLQENKDGAFIPMGNPLVNEEGVSSIIGICQAIINRHTILSNISDTQIRVIMDFFADTLSRDLMINRIKYEITDASARDKIFWEALSITYVTLLRGYNEGDKKFWKGSTQEIRTTTTNTAGQGKGLLSFLGQWNK